MSQAQTVIKKFGGIRPMSRATGIAASTIQGWQDTGFIAAKRQQEILDAAATKGVDLSPTDFLPSAPNNSNKEGAAA